MKKYFFEIPVYRLSEAQYKEEMKTYIRKSVPTYDGPEQLLQYRVQNPEQDHPDSLLVGMLCREFGGPWMYNEIIGHLRLYLYHSQIRVEYWQVQSKRIVKSRRKLFGRNSPKIVDEINIKDRSSNSEIKKATEDTVKACEQKFKRRHLDLRYFYAIKDHVNWAEVIANV
ncbi:MAG: hypothetical protein V4732_17015 [Pseudomonadota bacterium]